MQVSETIGTEAVFFLLSVAEGVGLVLVYDMFRILRRILKHGTVLIGMEDICYWVFCTIAVFLLLYQKNDGMLRLFAFVGILTGMAIYYLLFSRFIIKLFVLVFGGILKGLQKGLGIVCRPFFKILKKRQGSIRKTLKKIGRAIKIGLIKR